MYQLSSSATLILRLFIPTIWTVFFGSFTIVGWMTSEDFVGPFHSTIYRAVTTLFLVVGLILIRISFWRLHRIDADPGHLFVSNYFKTYKYPLAAMEQITIRHYGLFYLGRVELVLKGKLGRRIWFVPSRKRIEQFVRNNPNWMDLLKWS
ncbi:MAG: hypothetical protein K9I85_05230 [Saprospiraceae bacterium]|nr:hypothetical protein [Saprospiraceae bacterium]